MQSGRRLKKRNKNPQSIRYVIRIDSSSTHGFQVRVPINGKQESRFFSDNVYGGKLHAKKAAIDYRDKECRKRKIIFHPKRTMHGVDPRNTSGRVGVSVLWRTVGDYQYKYYVASASVKLNSQTRKSFSVNKYGERKARKLAIAAREEMEKEIMAVSY